MALITVAADGRLDWRGRAYRCAIGAAGITDNKREGDGATPTGYHRLRRVLFRPDRRARPATRLEAAALAPDDAWCDDPRDAAYNRPVKLPHSGHSEALWRPDSLYDLVAVLGYNDDPVAPGRGSAIFLHVAAPDFAGTRGCIAVAREDLLTILAQSSAADSLFVRA